MKFLKKEKYRYWLIALITSLLLLLLDSWFGFSSPKTTIFVNAPENMHDAFVQTLDDTRLDKKYQIEFTDDIKSANFVVTQGSTDDGKLIAYSPIVAVFSPDEDLYNDLIAKKIFVKSTVSSESNVDSEEYDFDFKKIIDSIVLEDSDFGFKIYYPSEHSDTWEEFYSFLLFTVNDGYYPKEGKDMESSSTKIEAFLNSRYTESIDITDLKRTNGFAKDSIYFMPFVDLKYLYDNSGSISCRVMYPKAVVYHNYYANYDETGQILYDALDLPEKGIFAIKGHSGYYNLRSSCYHTKYSKSTNYIGNAVLGDTRNTFNGIEIPRTTRNDNDKEDLK